MLSEKKSIIVENRAKGTDPEKTKEEEGEERMEAFKRELKKRIAYIRWFIIALALIGAYDYFMIRNTGEKTIAQKVAIGFQIAILVAIGILACIYLIKLTSTLWDEEKVRLLYAQEHDDTMKRFQEKAGMPMILISSMAMVLIGAVAAYFSIAVFYTLIAAAAAQMAAVTAMFFYYTRKKEKSQKTE